ncbi:MAG: crossover junction endodeoxyribonuclease RuvC [Phycisphaerae bacterium]
MEVCGIDPGLEVSGYAVIAINSRSTTIREAGICRTDPHAPLPERLAQIEADFNTILERWRPQAVGVEQLYAHYKHPRTAILMGHARGVILAAAERMGVTVYSFNPTQVKRYLTGNGRASKTQVQRAIMASFGLTTPPEPHDVADALAIGLCCANECRQTQRQVARV